MQPVLPTTPNCRRTPASSPARAKTAKLLVSARNRSVAARNTSGSVQIRGKVKFLPAAGPLLARKRRSPSPARAAMPSAWRVQSAGFPADPRRMARMARICLPMLTITARWYLITPAPSAWAGDEARQIAAYAEDASNPCIFLNVPRIVTSFRSRGRDNLVPCRDGDAL